MLPLHNSPMHLTDYILAHIISFVNSFLINFRLNLGLFLLLPMIFDFICRGAKLFKYARKYLYKVNIFFILLLKMCARCVIMVCVIYSGVREIMFFCAFAEKRGIENEGKT